MDDGVNARFEERTDTFVQCLSGNAYDRMGHGFDTLIGRLAMSAGVTGRVKTALGSMSGRCGPAPPLSGSLIPSPTSVSWAVPGVITCLQCLWE